MSGEKINYYGSTNTSLDSIMETIDADRMAKIDSISLTNMSTTSVPAIEGNSVVEIANSVYRFSTEEAISTSNIASTAAMTYYVELVPSSSQVSAQFSSDVPTWRSDYQGFYTSTTSANRNIGFTYFDGTNYNDKFLMKWHGGVYLDNKIYVNNTEDSTETTDGAIISAGSVNAAGNMIAGGDIYAGDDITANDDITAGGDIYATGDIYSTSNIYATNDILSSGYMRSEGGRYPTGTFRDDSATEDDLFTDMYPDFAISGNYMIVSGCIKDDVIVAYARLASTSQIIVYGWDLSLNASVSRTIDAGSTSDASGALAW